MANIEHWYDVVATDSCVPYNVWNEMIDQIILNQCPTKGLLDFSLYSNCSDAIGEKFKFTFSGDDSKLYGANLSGYDLFIYSNSSDLCPLIVLEGNAGIINKIKYDSSFLISSCSDVELFKVDNDTFYYKGTDIIDYIDAIDFSCPSDADLPFTLYNDCATKDEKGFQFSISGSKSILEGSDDTGDDLEIRSNSSDACSLILLEGDAGITNKIKYDSSFIVSTCSDVERFKIDSANGLIDHHCLEADNFRLENRTSDPVSPCIGQMWFRTDL